MSFQKTAPCFLTFCSSEKFLIQNVCFIHYYNTMLYKHIKLTVVINISVPIVETNTSDSR